jgi:hypothetical protein
LRYTSCKVHVVLLAQISFFSNILTSVEAKIEDTPKDDKSVEEKSQPTENERLAANIILMVYAVLAILGALGCFCNLLYKCGR